MGDTIGLEHVLRSGEKILPLYSHMDMKCLFNIIVSARVAKGC